MFLLSRSMEAELLHSISTSGGKPCHNSGREVVIVILMNDFPSEEISQDSEAAISVDGRDDQRAVRSQKGNASAKEHTRIFHMFDDFAGQHDIERCSSKICQGRRLDIAVNARTEAVCIEEIDAVSIEIEPYCFASGIQQALVEQIPSLVALFSEGPIRASEMKDAFASAILEKKVGPLHDRNLWNVEMGLHGGNGTISRGSQYPV